jgi:hypothetical protein
MEVDSIRKVNMPRYDELSVKNFWPQIQGNQRLMRFFPDKLPKGRQPDHEYFWNVFNTLEEPYVRQLIAYANEQRNSADAEGMQRETIVVSEVMANKLNQFPFQSSKSSYLNMFVKGLVVRRCFCLKKAPSLWSLDKRGARYRSSPCLRCARTSSRRSRSRRRARTRRCRASSRRLAPP